MLTRACFPLKIIGGKLTKEYGGAKLQVILLKKEKENYR